MRTSETVENLREFVAYTQGLEGDEKGRGTKFADLLWRPRLLLEMKRRGEKLERHYSQAFDYWLQLVPQRPRYVVLCNFDESGFTTSTRSLRSL